MANREKKKNLLNDIGKKCLFPYKQIKNQRNNLPLNALRKETCQIKTRLKEMKLDANSSLLL